MAVFKPFKAFRPRPDKAEEVAAKPYDVLNSEEARREVEGLEYSFLRIGKPEVDLTPGINVYDIDVYKKGKENLQKFIDDGVLVKDAEPCFYLNAQTMDGRTQYGIVGCASVDDYNNDVIKKHEFTRPQKEEDRCEHVRVTNAHTGPIFLTYRDNSKINAIVEDIKTKKPEADFTDAMEVRHQVWAIKDDSSIETIQKCFEDTACLYVADGHHRSAAAAIVGKECQDANPNHTGNEEYNFFLSVLFPASELYIMDYNRVVKDLNGHSLDGFLSLLSDNFEVSKSDKQLKPEKKGDFGLYIDKQWYKLNARKHLLKNNDPVESLDVAILQKYVLSDLLNIENPRTDTRIDFVGGIRGLKELEARVDSGEMKLAFSMYPTSIDELMNIADAGEVMPPKSTWFEPKLKDGLFVHFLD